MRLREGLGLLTYCTNVHKGESWAEVRRVLEKDVLAVKREVSPHAPFGVGLRLSARALAEVSRPAEIEALRAFLQGHDLSVFTLNAFPYGAFHGTRVKESVYLPDWRDEGRLAYTNAAADLLADLLTDEGPGSVSTVPGAFRPAVGPDAVLRIADNLVRHAAHLVELERRTGRLIQLALEPEPSCVLETTAEAVDFFRTHLISRGARARLAALTGIAVSEAEDALRRHLGICLDLCHMAVEFEDPAASFALLRDAGIFVPKLQVSAGLRVAPVDAAALDALRSFEDDVYLHQVVERRDGALRRYVDLPDALATNAAATTEAGDREWRVHYHVPLFLGDLGAFRSTQAFVEAALDLHARAPVTRHLEVETYTWDVLPERWRAGGLVAAISRELQWTRRHLES